MIIVAGPSGKLKLVAVYRFCILVDWVHLSSPVCGDASRSRWWSYTAFWGTQVERPSKDFCYVVWSKSERTLFMLKWAPHS